MVKRIISWCFHHPFYVTLTIVLAIAWGVYAVRNMPLDAIPDLSDPQVIIFTEWPGRSPDLIEDQITYPIVSAMVAAPKVKTARGYSMFGMSFVYLLLEEKTDLYWARSRILEYMSKLSGQLPDGVQPTLGPDASGVGWVFQYSLVDESGKNKIADLRALQDWKLRYLVEAVPGVAEVASVGGYVQEYQVQLNPNLLQEYNLTIHDVMMAIKKSNRDVGGRTLEMSEREYYIRSNGYIHSLDDIRSISLRTDTLNRALTVGDVASVAIVPSIRRGAVDLNGKGEAVSAIVIVRYGEDVYSVIQNVKAAIEQFKPSLPDGVSIITTYDRSTVITNSIHTLVSKLIDEMLVVGLVIILFLWHWRSSLVPIITLPIAVLLSFIPMYYFGITSNIMSLGGIAIAIGAMVDAAIVLVENTHKSIEKWRHEGKKEPIADILLHSCIEVGRPIFFSLLVIAVAFMPIFTLEGQEGRLFKPLAFTKNFSMLFAALLSITLAPVLIRWLIRDHDNHQDPSRDRWFHMRRIHDEEYHPVSRFLHRIYTPLLEKVLAHRKSTLVITLVLLLSTVPAFLSLGREFMPPLNEGDLLYMPTTLPGLSIETAKHWMREQNTIITSFGEVKSAFGKAGRAETATDPAPLSMVETVIQLHPISEWPKIHHDRWYSSWAPDWLHAPLALIWPEMKQRTWQELIRDLNTATSLPGTMNAWTFPIKTRIDMLTTGIRTPIGIKVFGDDLATTEKVAVDIEQAIRSIPRTRSVIAERSFGGYYIDITPNREALASFGLTIEDVNTVIEGVLGAEQLTTIVKGRARFPVTVRYQSTFRDSVADIERALVAVSADRQIPLGDVADIRINQGPSMIKDENGLLSTWVYVDLEEGSDIAGYVTRLREKLSVPGFIPSGYTYTISGQFEHMERAESRLLWVGLITLGIVLFLIHTNTRSWIRTGIVMCAVPFSLIGAVWILYFLGYNLSTAVWVGMIALAGVDAETGIVMLMYLDLAYDRRHADGTLRTHADLKEVIMEGAVKRVRPKIMTVATTFIGLLPIMFAGLHETGADVAKRIAAPMVGGILTSFAMELLIYPLLYMMWKERQKGDR